MNIHYGDDRVTVHHGDCLDVMRGMPADSVDAVICDPPYGLEFMGKDWDSFKTYTGGNPNMKPQGATVGSEPSGVTYGYRQKNPRCTNCGKLKRGNGSCKCADPRWDTRTSESAFQFQHWCEQWATEALRILKPGGHLLAFGGTRTFHRLTCAIEDAGLEIRDSIAWLYGSGFPKSLDVSKAIDKAAGATREVVGKHASPAGNKPGGASLNMSVVGMPETADITAPATPAAQQWQGWGTALKPAFEPIVVARKPLTGTVAANVQAHGTGALNIDATRVAGEVPHTQGGMTSGGIMAGSTGERRDPFAPHAAGRWPTNVVLDGHAAAELDAGQPVTRQTAHTRRRAGGVLGNGVTHGDFITAYDAPGGPSRFFPVFRYQAKAPTRERPKINGVAHPTCKPLELMRWLVRLTVGGRPDATVLDPFAGSGTTLEACLLEGVRSVGIERETDYLPLIMRRITRAYITKTPADDDEDVS